MLIDCHSKITVSLTLTLNSVKMLRLFVFHQTICAAVIVSLSLSLIPSVNSSSGVVYTSSTTDYDVTRQNVTYEWRTSTWSACIYRTPVADPYQHPGLFNGNRTDFRRQLRPVTAAASVTELCCSCFRIRNVTCFAFETSSSGLHQTESDVAPFHCVQQLAVEHPVSVESCWPCRQDCVVTTWSAWSRGGEGCADQEYDDGTVRWCRTRTVLVMPTGDGTKCGPLVETERRPGDVERLLPVRFRWQTGGQWTGCRVGQVCTRLESRLVDASSFSGC